MWKQVFTGNKSLPQKIVNNRDCVIQSWPSAYAVTDAAKEPEATERSQQI